MHITFLVTPGPGHLNPTLGVAAELVRRGYRVTYPVPAALLGAVKETGAEPVLYESPLHQGMSGPPRVLTGSFFVNFQLRLLEESLAVAPALEEHLAGEPPELIAFDSMGHFGARVLGHAWGVPLAALAPSLVSNEHFSLWGAFAKQRVVPPADDDPVINEFRQRFRAFASSRGVPADQVATLAKPFTPGDEPQIVFVPRWFQPAGETFDDRYSFVGPCLTERAHQGDWQPPETGPVLLISLGTAFNERPEFFRTCVKAFTGTPWQVIIAIGTRIDPVELGTLPGNVSAAAQVPQLHVLRHSSAFISHGGMGSTMEALYHGVPLVVVPQMPEQQANGQRVTELGLGRMLRAEEATADALREAVTELTADQAVRARLDKRGRELREVNGAALAADVMEAHATASSPGRRA